MYLFCILADTQRKINVFIRAEDEADEKRNKCKEVQFEYIANLY